MKKIFRIAAIEVANMFYSPIAWLVLIIFLIQCAMAYSGAMEGWVTQQELGGNYRENIEFLTTRIFGYPFGMLGNVTTNLYLYLPLLTMGLISRELSNGTIKLLYSSPVTIKDIILGKFVAIGSYCLLLTLMFGVFLFVGTFHVQHADKGLMLSMMLGLFLLLCAYSAIGLFVSCLTSYQVVAAISTFVFFAFLSYIGTIWQDIDFVRDITYSLSLQGRIFNMGNGLITSKDLLYFSAIIYIFIGLSMLKLQATRSTDSNLLKTLKYAAVIVSGIVIGFISSRPVLTGYFDATETKTMTLTPVSQQILKQMGDEPMEITSYINLLDDFYWQGTPAGRNDDLERWLPYIRFKPNIKFNYVYYYDSVLSNPYYYKQFPGKTLDEIADNYVKSFRVRKSLFKKPAEIQKIINLRPELNRYVMHIKYKGKSTFLRLFNDPLVFPTEMETGAALKRLITKLPKIAFLEGELERSAKRAADKDYKTMTSDITFRYSMVNQGFDFTTVSLKDGEIPADVSALVIADPRQPFEPQVQAKIEKFIDDGGNVLIAGEPGKQSVLNPLLEKLGIKMTEGMMVQKSDDYSPSLTFNFLTAYAGFSKAMKKAIADSNRVSMPTVTGLLYDTTGKFTIHPLLATDDKKAWRKMGELSSDSVQVNFTAADGDEKGKFYPMLGLTRKLNSGKEQHIIVSADADFMSNIEMSRFMPGVRNFAYSTSLFGWLSNGEFPVDVTRPDSLDKSLNLKGENIFILNLVMVWIIPAILSILVIIWLLRRKRQ